MVGPVVEVIGELLRHRDRPIVPQRPSPDPRDDRLVLPTDVLGVVAGVEAVGVETALLELDGRRGDFPAGVARTDGLGAGELPGGALQALQQAEDLAAGVALGVTAPPHLVQSVLAADQELPARRCRRGGVVGPHGDRSEGAAHRVGEGLDRQRQILGGQLPQPAGPVNGRRRQHDPRALGCVGSFGAAGRASGVLQERDPRDEQRRGGHLPDGGHGGRGRPVRPLGVRGDEGGEDLDEAVAGTRGPGMDRAVRILEVMALLFAARAQPAVVEAGGARRLAAGCAGQEDDAGSRADRVAQRRAGGRGQRPAPGHARGVQRGDVHLHGDPAVAQAFDDPRAEVDGGLVVGQLRERRVGDERIEGPGSCRGHGRGLSGSEPRARSGGRRRWAGPWWGVAGHCDRPATPHRWSAAAAGGRAGGAAAGGAARTAARAGTGRTGRDEREVVGGGEVVDLEGHRLEFADLDRGRGVHARSFQVIS